MKNIDTEAFRREREAAWKGFDDSKNAARSNIWQKGVPPKSMFVWVKWFDPSWMKYELTELAHFHPNHGMEFWGDEPDWDIEKVNKCDFLYLEIETPEGAVA